MPTVPGATDDASSSGGSGSVLLSSSPDSGVWLVLSDSLTDIISLTVSVAWQLTGLAAHATEAADTSTKMATCRVRCQDKWTLRKASGGQDKLTLRRPSLSHIRYGNSMTLSFPCKRADFHCERVPDRSSQAHLLEGSFPTMVIPTLGLGYLNFPILIIPCFRPFG